MSAGLRTGVVGDLFWRVDDAVVLMQRARVKDWNPAAERRFGIPRADALAPGFDLSTVLGRAVPAFSELVSTGGSARLVCDGGCGLVLDATVWQLGDSDIVVCLMRDVTAQVRLTRGLGDLSRLGRDLIAGEPATHDVLQDLVDAAKSVTGAAFSALLVVRAGETAEVSHFVYNAPRERFPERLPRVVGLLEVALNAGGPVRLDDIRPAPGGVGIPVKHPPIGPLLAVPVSAGDVLLGLVAVANEPGQRTFDETDERLLADLAGHAGTAVRWAQARELARLQQTRRAEVAAAARHDIRNPLAAGKGYARMLQTKADRMSPEMITEAYEHIARVFDRIETFTDRLLAPEDGEPPSGSPRWAMVDVETLLERLAADHRAASGSSQLAVVKVRGTPSSFAADPDMVHEALENLVTNAFKYGDPRQPVTVTARTEGGRLRFDVHNHGDGIPAEEQDRIFDRYWRPDRVRDEGPEGTGLGLAIVREIAQAHAGIAGVSSRPEEGTTFWITFPRTLPTEDSQPPAAG